MIVAKRFYKEVGPWFYGYVAIWAGCLILLVFFWKALPLAWTLSVVGSFFAPDLGSLRQMFSLRRSE